MVAAGTVFGADNHAVAYALNSVTGKVRWRNKIGRLSAASPAYHDRRVFYVDLEPARIMALDYRTGKKIWQRELPDRSESSPVVEDGKVIFGCESGDVFALSEQTGKTIWQHHVSGAVKGGVAVDGRARLRRRLQRPSHGPAAGGRLAEVAVLEPRPQPRPRRAPSTPPGGRLRPRLSRLQGRAHVQLRRGHRQDRLDPLDRRRGLRGAGGRRHQDDAAERLLRRRWTARSMRSMRRAARSAGRARPAAA